MIGSSQDAQVFYRALTFRQLLDSLARPGKINLLGQPHFLITPYSDMDASLSMNMYALGAMLTLLDREVSFGLVAHGQWLDPSAPAVQWVALRSGASSEPPEQAAFALFCDGSGGDVLARLSQGSMLEPELSATAIYCVEQIAAAPEELIERSERAEYVTLELSGPGIERTRTISIAGLGRMDVASIKHTRRSYPLGIDVYCIDARGRCIGLPRTTRIQLVGQDK